MNTRQLNWLCRYYLRISVKKFMEIEPTKAEEVESKYLYGYLSAGAIDALYRFADRLETDRMKAVWIEFETKLKEIMNKNGAD